MSVNKNVLLVCSPYYQQITDNLIKGAIKILKSKSVNYKVLYVPGALEIAPAIRLIYEKSKNNPIIDGYIALGCVIRGETYHFEIVSNESARALCDLSIKFSIPIGNGILTVENEAQAIARSDNNKNNKGYHAAYACHSLVKLKENF